MHSDLISILSHLITDNKFQFIAEHVKAHQDEHHGPLSVKEYLNCKMDALAKNIAHTYMTQNLQFNFSPTNLGLGTVSCNGLRITSRFQQSLYHHVTQRFHVNRLGHLLHLRPSLMYESVNWKVLSSSRKLVSLQIKLFITKWISGDTATGSVMVKRKQRLSAHCPLCQHPHEDTHRILKCPSNSASSLRQRLLTELQCWLQSVDTHPDIIAFLINGLTSWLVPGRSFHLDTSVDFILLKAFRIQLQLGWEAQLLGLLTSPLLMCQH